MYVYYSLHTFLFFPVVVVGGRAMGLFPHTGLGFANNLTVITIRHWSKKLSKELFQFEQYSRRLA